MAEKEYVDREAVLESISGLTWYSKNKKGVLNIGAVNRKEAYYPAGNVFDAVESVPAADVAPVVHGEWIVTKTEFGWNSAEYPTEYTCSVCGRTERQTEPYCHCGAKMDGGKTE